MSPDSASQRPEDLFSGILDSMEDGMTILDSELRILYANRPMKELYPEVGTLEGLLCYVAFQARTEPCPNCPALRALGSGVPERSEITAPPGGGGGTTWDLFARPIFDDAGRVTAVFETVRDVTVEREAERFRTERQDLFRALFEDNISAMLLIDPESAQIRDANQSACEFYGFSRAELTSMKLPEIHTLSEAEIFEEMGRAKEEKRNYFNFVHRMADGELREVEVFSGPIQVGGKALLCSIVHDVSERKSAERERERLIQDLRTALSEVKTLQGLIPICASCNKIRDDEGYWSRIEDYISQHSEAELTHGLCPPCIKKLYPDLAEEI